ncbi:MAG: immunoglobulin domain-containing protein [Verrucomicrobia bacterium]|nr:immunoglobulin domain-containing protein [Verrucomicrobiota bacterium]
MIWTVILAQARTLLNFKSAWLWSLLLGFTGLPVLQASPKTAYFLGNSFTWDGQPHNMSTSTTFPNELDPTIGWSIYSGKSLSFIVDNPEGVVKEVGFVASDYYPDPSFSGNFETDLPGHTWDVVSFQPHTYGAGLIIEDEIAAAHTVITTALQNAQNNKTQFYVFGPWAFQESADKNNGRFYSENWLSGYSESQLNSGKLPNVRQAFRSLYWDRLKTENPGVTINWIPIGEVLYNLDQQLRGGALAGLNGSWDLFDQYGVHLHDTDEDGIAGRYISLITTLSTVWGSHPSKFQTKYDGVIETKFKALVDDVVWDTILAFYPDIASVEEELIIETGLIRHPGLPGDLMKSSRYVIGARLGENQVFGESATLEYATNFGGSNILNDPYNISNATDRNALADVSHWTSVSYGNNGNPLQFEVALSSEEAITSCEVYPGRYQVPATIEDGKAYLTIHAPNRYLYLVINGNKEHPLFLFVDPLEENPPSNGDEGVLYYGPGIHDIGKNFTLPENIHTVYIALGAYLKGSIFANGRSDISVRGRGILSGESYGLDSEVNAAIHFDGLGTNQLIEGITSIRSLKYHIISRGTLTTRNVKCLSYNTTTDGIVAGVNSLIEHSFFKVNDDVIKLYYDNQIVRDIVVYHQTNSPVFEFGWSGQESKNSLVQRIDIVEDNTLGVNVTGQAILGWTHNSKAGGAQKGHIFEDIRAENGKKRLMHLNIDNAPGLVEIICRNWSIRETEDTSDLFAVSPGRIKIAFENVIVDGQHVDGSEFQNVGDSNLQLDFKPLESTDLPSIVTQPSGALVSLDDDVLLSVEAEGPGALDYQWRKNGVPMPAATASTFSLRGILTEATAEYDVVISNPFGSSTSRSAFVSFFPIDQSISFVPPNDVSILEEFASLHVSASSGLDVELELISGPATLSEQTLTFTGHGEVVVRASQPGTDLWNSAEPVERSFNVYSIADTWRLENLGTAESVGDAADLADPDFDQIPNLFEYYLGTSPLGFDSKIIFAPLNEDSDFDYETTQAYSSLDGLEAVIETSSNLIEWIELDPNLVHVEVTGGGDLHYRIKTKNLPAPFFIRLRVLAR